ncbi:MAG: hypothetical protein AAGC67_03815 [Myxococcota bacterium]
MRWLRYGFCTCLGLVVIGLAAVSPDPTPDASGGTDVPTDVDLA